MLSKSPILIIVIGLMLLAVGLLFKIMLWPDMFQGLYSGWVVLIIGIVMLIVKRKN
jgi:hypothetical protein